MGLAAVGNYRARPYRKVGNLGALIEKCWQVPPETTRYISEPLAAMLDRYLPERAKQTLEVGLDPATVLIGCWRVLAHCKEQEERVLATYLSRDRVSPVERAPDPVPATEPAEEREAGLSFDVLDTVEA